MRFEPLPSFVYLILSAWSIWAWVCWANVIVYKRRHNRWKKREAELPRSNETSLNAMILAPVKGLGPHFDRHLRLLLRQNYPSYRIIFSFESKEDPARRHLLKLLSHDPNDGRSVLNFDRTALLQAWNQISPGLEKIRIVIAGKTKDSGQKIHNLTAAWRNDERYGEIIAFADADSLWDLKTLRNLVIPLKQRDVGLCTGYRWIVPEDHAIPSILASVINGSVSTALGPSWRNSGWGGAMAIRRTLFDNLDIPGFWQGKLNDDVSLTRHLQNQRLKVSFAPGVTPVNLVKLDWLGLIAFGRRQYIQLWHYHFLLWFYGVLITSSNVHCWIIAIILIFLGNAWGLTFAGLVFVSDMCRALARRRVVRSLLPEWAVARLNRVFWFDFLLTPFWYFVHYCLVWSTLFSRRLKWSGITYEISSNTVRVISRDG